MKLTFPALAAFLFLTVPAAAFPAAGNLKDVDLKTEIVEVQYRHPTRPHYHQPRHRPYHPQYRAGHRYKSAPRGWRRYSARPGDWQRRGCIIVGPVWFCP